MNTPLIINVLDKTCYPFNENHQDYEASVTLDEQHPTQVIFKVNEDMVALIDLNTYHDHCKEFVRKFAPLVEASAIPALG